MNISMQHTSTYTAKSRKSRRAAKLALSILLWSIQVLLALVFLFAGSMKLMMPLALMESQMAIPLPGLFIYFIAVAEIAGALGLILPGLFRIRRILTPLAACGLIIIMIGATTITLLGGGGIGAAFPALVGTLCLVVVRARRSWAY